MKKITFTLPAAALGAATEALLLGDFNEWNPEKALPLVLQKDGSFAATIELEAGKTYEYRFLLNNGTWVNDWNAQQYVHNAVFGVENSVIAVPANVVKKKTEVKKATQAQPASKKAATTKVKKEKTAPAASDNLTKIEGIGPKIAKLLEAQGITSFAALGKATSKKLKGILENAGPKFQLHDPASWPKQAKLAASEKWDELKALQDQLIAGK